MRDQYLEDICAFSGATYIDSKIGRKLADMTIDDLGSVERVMERHMLAEVHLRGGVQPRAGMAPERRGLPH